MKVNLIRKLWRKRIGIPLIQTQAEKLMKKVDDKIKKNKNK
jgi:hypothetical protein